MLLKSHKRVLKFLRKEHKRISADISGDNVTIPISAVQTRFGLSRNDTLDICLNLHESGFVNFVYVDVEDPPSSVFLTVKAKRPFEQLCASFTDYIKNNWISIIALILSIISIFISLD